MRRPLLEESVHPFNLIEELVRRPAGLAVTDTASSNFDVHRGRPGFEQEFHHTRIDDVVGESLIARFDEKVLAEFRTFEIDIVEAEHARQAIEHVLRTNHQIGYCAVGQVNDQVTEVVRRGMTALSAAPGDLVPKVADLRRGADPENRQRASQGVVRHATVAAPEDLEVAVLIVMVSVVCRRI